MAAVDMGGTAGLVTGLLTAIATLVGAVTVWRKSRSEAATGLAGQLEDHMERQDARIEKLEAKVAKYEERERLLIQYIFELQLYIQSGGEPPGPPWPVVLLPKTTNPEENQQ